MTERKPADSAAMSIRAVPLATRQKAVALAGRRT